jgi:hypothetical protein
LIFAFAKIIYGVLIFPRNKLPLSYFLTITIDYNVNST